MTWLVLALVVGLVLGRKAMMKKALGGLRFIHKTTRMERKAPIESTYAHDTSQPERIAVLKFNGDLFASEGDRLSRLIDEVVTNRHHFSRVIAVVNSPGGSVAHYGRMYAEMDRIRRAGIPLEACVDTYAASGGYLMILPAMKIYAAPFSIVGSIGVAAEFLNFHDLLRDVGVTPLTITAGKYKRTLTRFGEVTHEGRNKFEEDINAIHDQFKEVVTRHRENVNPDRVFTGEHWTAQDSLRLGLNLVDEIMTSSQRLLEANMRSELVILSEKKRLVSGRLSSLLSKLIDHTIDRFLTRLHHNLP